MENVTNNYFFIIGGFIAIIAELILGVSTGFDLLIIGVILITAGGVGLLFQSFAVALISASVFSLLYVFVARKFVRQKLTITTTATNADALPGKQGMVTKKITPDTPGQVKVDGEIWRAFAKTTIDEATPITVQSVSGVTLTVTKTV